MIESRLFYELIVVIYACSVLLYFFDFLQPDRKVNRIAFWLLSIVWIFQGIHFLTRMISYQAFPLLTQFDTLFFYAWLLISLSLIINWFFRMDFLLFFTNIIGFSVMAVSVFWVGNELPQGFSEQLSSEWLAIHIAMAFLSYASFTLSFIFSLGYLFQHYMLKKKKWGNILRRWPSLALLDQLSFSLNMYGVPLLTLSLILGIVWANFTLEGAFWLDAKVIFSVFVIFMYGFYFYKRLVQKWSGKRIVQLNLICFMILLINYLIASLFSRFHLWL